MRGIPTWALLLIGLGVLYVLSRTESLAAGLTAPYAPSSPDEWANPYGSSGGSPSKLGSEDDK